MILLFHIMIALSSLVITGLAYLTPSRAKLKVSYTLVGLTVASGTWLVVANPAHLVQSCISGLTFLAVTFTGIILTQRKLAKAVVKIDDRMQ